MVNFKLGLFVKTFYIKFPLKFVTFWALPFCRLTRAAALMSTALALSYNRYIYTINHVICKWGLMLRYFVRWVYKKYSELIHGNGIKSILTNVFSATSHKIRYIPLYLAILAHDNNVNKTHVPNHVTLITLTITVTFRSELILTMCLETARALLQRPVIVVVGECACSLCHPTLATAAVWDCRDATTRR